MSRLSEKERAADRRHAVHPLEALFYLALAFAIPFAAALTYGPPQ